MIRQAGTATLVALVLVAVGAGAGYLARQPSPPSSLQPPTQATAAPVTTQEFTDERTVQLRARVAPSVPLTLGLGGRVTASMCEPGGALKSGAVIARVDEVPLIALATEVPIYRDLTTGDEGRDVSSLQRALRRAGHRLKVDGTYGWKTRVAFQELQESAGVAEPDGELRAAHVVWLPEPKVSPQTCSIAVGQQIQPGAEFASLPERLSALVVDPLPDFLAPGERVITVWGVSGPVSDQGAVADRDFLVELSQTQGFRNLASTDEQISARIALESPMTVLKVPPSAVFGIEGSVGCILSGGRATPVEIVGSELGTSLVVPNGGLALNGEVPATVNLGPGVAEESCGERAGD